jgi:oligopeptide/dipeptide ABC transporter ATP-binding protein
MSAYLEIETLGLTVGGRPILHDISLAVNSGETVGLVGESGSGKSLTARSVLRLLPPDSTTRGSVRAGDIDVLTASRAALSRLRRRDVSMIYQDPRAAVNPVRRVGDFVIEALRTQGRVSASAARRKAVQILEEVGLPDPPRQLRQYPHELSGGMLQRVVIAAAIAPEPKLLLADEPTTALDVTTQAEIVALLAQLSDEHGMGTLFITHDLELAAALCERICVLYAGSVVEQNKARELFTYPAHPYTAALLDCRPRLSIGKASGLTPLPGRAVSRAEAPPGCSFSTRCSYAQDACRVQEPTLTSTLRGGEAACLRLGEIDLTHTDVSASAPER